MPSCLLVFSYLSRIVLRRPTSTNGFIWNPTPPYLAPSHSSASLAPPPTFPAVAPREGSWMDPLEEDDDEIVVRGNGKGEKEKEWARALGIVRRLSPAHIARSIKLQAVRIGGGSKQQLKEHELVEAKTNIEEIPAVSLSCGRVDEEEDGRIKDLWLPRWEWEWERRSVKDGSWGRGYMYF